MSFQQLAQRYVEVWNESDPQARATGVRALFADDVRYVDPFLVADGHAAVDAAIAAVQARFPGWRFRLTGPVDGYHDQARFAWGLGPDGTDAPIAGFDVAVVAADGRLQTVLGFLDRVPQS